MLRDSDICKRYRTNLCILQRGRGHETNQNNNCSGMSVRLFSIPDLLSLTETEPVIRRKSSAYQSVTLRKTILDVISCITRSSFIWSLGSSKQKVWNLVHVVHIFISTHSEVCRGDLNFKNILYKVILPTYAPVNLSTMIITYVMLSKYRSSGKNQSKHRPTFDHFDKYRNSIFSFSCTLIRRPRCLDSICINLN